MPLGDSRNRKVPGLHQRGRRIDGPLWSEGEARKVPRGFDLLAPGVNPASTYTRILKKCCGHPNATALRSNVFQEDSAPRSCTISYALDGVNSSVDWNPDGGLIEVLLPVDIFDTTTSRVYLNGETEATYTPPAVLLFEELGSFCDRVRGILESEQSKLVLLLPF